MKIVNMKWGNGNYKDSNVLVEFTSQEVAALNNILYHEQKHGNLESNVKIGLRKDFYVLFNLINYGAIGDSAIAELRRIVDFDKT